MPEDNEHKPGQARWGTTPIPDPTTLTTELVDRAIGSLKSELNIRFNAIDERFVAGAEVIKSNASSLRELMQQKDCTLKEHLIGLLEKHAAETIEKFGGSRLAVEAAFAATKEATNKSEEGFAKQLDAVSSILTSKTDNLSNQITSVKDNLSGQYADLKDRVTAVEAGMRSNRDTIRSTWTYIGGAAAIAASMASVIGFLVSKAG